MEHAAFRRTLAQAFGGFTTTAGAGFWTNPAGNPFSENVIVYDVAIPDTVTSRAGLVELAKRAAGRMHQQALYIRIGERPEILQLDAKAAPQAA